MPPQISDDEGSVSGESVSASPAPVKQEVKSKNAKAQIEDEPEEKLMVESEHDDNEDSDLGDGEFVVEKIISHLVDEETGELKFEVKWEGYEKKSDRTWEAEENLETASKILNEYLSSVGGREAIMNSWEEKKAAAAAKKGGKKRARASTGTGTPQPNGSKRGKKNNGHPGSTSPPLSAVKAEFKPPTGSWEEDVTAVDACEGENGSIIVYLTWQTGNKTQHPLSQVYKRCPQKMLKFYESHLVFKKNDPTH